MATTFREAFRAERPPPTATNGQHRRGRTPLLVLLGRHAGRWLPAWRQFRTAALSTTAFGAFTVAGWWTDPRLGLVIGGASVLVLEALTGTEQ